MNKLVIQIITSIISLLFVFQVSAVTGPGSSEVTCEYAASGIISSQHVCAKPCDKNWLTGKEGTERQKCKQCLINNSEENGGDLKVDWSKIGSKRNDLSDCVKDDDGQKIQCPDGLYIKNGAVINSTRSINREVESGLHKKPKVKGSGPNAKQL